MMMMMMMVMMKKKKKKKKKMMMMMMMMMMTATTTTIIITIFRKLNSLNRLGFGFPSNCLRFHLRSSACEFHFIDEF
jgi:hypothetical protein